jgi:hypothetical protein
LLIFIANKGRARKMEVQSFASLAKQKKPPPIQISSVEAIKGKGKNLDNLKFNTFCAPPLKD